MTNKNEHNETIAFLQFLYKDTMKNERNLALRKMHLVSSGVFGLTLLFLFISLIVQHYSDIADNPFTIVTLSIFFSLFLVPLLTLYFLYLFYLTRYQRIYFTTSVVIEKYLYDYLFKKKVKEENIKEEVLSLLPIRRFIKESRLDRSGPCRKWFINSLTRQNRNDLLEYFRDSYK